MTTQTVDCVVVGLQTNPVAAGAPAVAGALLTWNGSAWAPGGIPVNIQSTLQVTGAVVLGSSLTASGNFNPANPAVYNMGASALAWNDIFCVNLTQTSDPRLKKHIHDAPSALGLVNAIPARTYRFKTEADDAPVHWGFLSTEVETVMGKQFAGVKTGDDPDKTQSITHSEMIAVLWRAVQELADLVRELQNNRVVSAASN